MIIASVALMSIVVLIAISLIYGLRKEACAEHIMITIGSLTVVYVAAMAVMLLKLFA